MPWLTSLSTLTTKLDCVKWQTLEWVVWTLGMITASRSFDMVSEISTGLKMIGKSQRPEDKNNTNDFRRWKVLRLRSRKGHHDRQGLQKWGSWSIWMDNGADCSLPSTFWVHLALREVEVGASRGEHTCWWPWVWNTSSQRSHTHELSVDNTASASNVACWWFLQGIRNGNL